MAGIFGRWLRRAGIGVVALAATFPANAACQLGKYLDLPVQMRGLRPMVSAQINHQDVQFLLDSGAFFSTLSRNAATQLGLKLDPAPPWFRLGGIKGEAEASVADVKTFGLGTATIPHIEFIVGGTEGREVGLLGQNFLHIGDVEYDLPHGGVRLLKATGCKAGETVYWAAGRPVTMVTLESDPDSHQLHTIGTITVNGVKMRAIFDTGAPTSILKLSAAKKAGLTPTSPGVVSDGYATGIGRGSTPAWIGTFVSIDIGGEAIRNPKIAFADIDLGEADLLIGADFFLTHRIYVSNKQNLMFVTYEGGPLFGLKPTGARLASGERIDLTDKSDAPTDAEGFARRAAVAASSGRTEDAIADFGKAIALDPKQGRYFRQRALARMANRQGLLAMSDLEKAIELDPADVEARLMRVRVHLAEHDPDGAVEDLHALDARLPPGDGQRLLVAGMADVAGHPDLAITEYDAWLATHKDDARRPEALNGRCWARAQLNRELPEALTDCNGALKLRPGNAPYLDSRALVYFREGNFKAALADYDTALKVAPEMSWALYARGLVKAKLGDAAGAKADHDAALKLDAHVGDRAHKIGLEG